MTEASTNTYRRRCLEEEKVKVGILETTELDEDGESIPSAEEVDEMLDEATE